MWLAPSGTRVSTAIATALSTLAPDVPGRTPIAARRHAAHIDRTALVARLGEARQIEEHRRVRITPRASEAPEGGVGEPIVG